MPEARVPAHLMQPYRIAAAAERPAVAAELLAAVVAAVDMPVAVVAVMQAAVGEGVNVELIQ